MSQNSIFISFQLERYIMDSFATMILVIEHYMQWNDSILNYYLKF